MARFETAPFNSVIQHKFRVTARLLGKTITDATAEALKEWTDRNIAQINLPFDTPAPEGSGSKQETPPPQDYRNDMILYAQEIVAQKTMSNPRELAGMMKDYKSRFGEQVYRDTLLPILETIR